jgi:transglutaminase-like putative cysteine protease
VYANQPITIGRLHHKNRFPGDKMMSRDHFSVLYDENDDKLFVKDEASTNGTYLTGFTYDGDRKYAKGIKDEFTRRAVAELEHERNFGSKDLEAPHGWYRNHPIIGRHSATVRNGVYGTSSSEFVLVDDKSALMKQVTDTFMSSLPSHEAAATMNEELLLKNIAFRVASVLRYDLNETERLSSPHYGKKGLIDLSEYVQAGVGVCRHQALLAAHLIEETISRGYLAGRTGVERNYDSEANGAHAWAVYKSETSEDVIVDPANHFVGSRKKAQDEGRWRYIVADDENNG